MHAVHAPSDLVDHIYQLSLKIVAGASLAESLDFVFESFGDLVPYDRIGYAEIDETKNIARAVWSRSTHGTLLRHGYVASLQNSSLSIVLKYRQPRILNNLPEYLEKRPDSRSTQLIVKEGIRSSMTCPLFVRDRPLGILFFSSRQCDAYDDSHVVIIKDISIHLAMLLMTSQPLATLPPASQPQSSQAVCEPPQREDELYFSQLRPGMRLADPIRFGNGGLLLASETELTQVTIDRLVALMQQGILSVSTVRVRYDA
ncbi:hypothetical protein Poly51_09410 [Rubripirellula tenax]|uniref:GAF domain-containing protein n=1 Tax=Rubripirellula tenax TaxID=2528015 RepID=A0A5C6FGP0_9BACT|nr:GAF domain-containing protein [Rubripirellula tenax]TWU60661.1 hypothetical protein Poly51_09410 [Rubripirellula tenax]